MRWARRLLLLKAASIAWERGGPALQRALSEAEIDRWVASRSRRLLDSMPRKVPSLPAPQWQKLADPARDDAAAQRAERQIQSLPPFSFGLPAATGGAPRERGRRARRLYFSFY
mmetsp:Transcript_64973/g.175580  ORF Transcript_64973/g.175580 Transcript_64973/m.175580 type:complete len:114 (+) Transcript_64973:810-1151(+)